MTDADNHQTEKSKMIRSALLALVTIAMTASPAIAEPIQWTIASGGNGHWYEFVDENPLTWEAAQVYAESRGGYLATITSPEEDAFLLSSLDIQTVPGCSCTWLGGFQNTNSPAYSEPAGGWEWVTGEPFTYSNWLPGEPNNYDGDERFLTISLELGAWNDHFQDTFPHQVIEWDTNPSTAPSSYSQTVHADSPVAYWRLNEATGPFIDQVGERSGTLTEGSLTTNEPGAILEEPNGAIKSGGAGGTVSVPYDPAMNALTFSIEAWVKYESNCTDGSGSGNHCNIAGTRNLATPGYMFGAFDTLPQMSHGFLVRDLANTCGLIGPQVALGEYYHVVGTYDGTTASLYVNGQLEEQQSPCPFIPHTEPFELFGSSNKAAENATLDEVAYYDYALGSDRVLAHYQAGLGIPSTCDSIGAFARSTLTLATNQNNHCENWFGVSQPADDLRNAVLSLADLGSANLAGSLLMNVDLSGASLVNASLVNARLEGADLSGTDLTSANLSFANLTGALYDELTIFPSGNTYDLSPSGLDGGITPWGARMIPTPEPGLGSMLTIGAGCLFVFTARKRSRSSNRFLN